MAWVKAVSYNGEDVFDESADDLTLLSKEWTSNMKKRVRDGYVDGVDAGEDALLQVGFNQGFMEGRAKTAAVGRLKGIVSAICSWCQIQHPESPVPASVTSLLQQITQHEERIMEGIRYALEHPPPSVSIISESMEDLEVEQRDSNCCGGGGCKETGCCKEGEKMDLNASPQQQKSRSGSTDCNSGSSESLDLLLQLCMDVVSELSLPQELISHIQELRNI
ncbi:OTU deubiquitinase with linear linkage specificity a [Notolabrus celidotus]|uniref:OTU deubiquitinase with linear linkage specificity a n=1 Tax=Notolabrus celidotus TaxID=1203425 RepID=UPI00148FCD29|nr:OTU deubiquitinase with linear linkage specificity a [Notolabrus celidotus]